MNTISSAVAEELLDTGVNCGINFAKPLLQRALNLLNNQGKAGWPDLAVDGIYGSATLNALKTFLTKRGKRAKKCLCEYLILCKASVILKSVSVIPRKNSSSMAGLLTGSASMKVLHCKRTKFASIITALCIMLSGCTAHTINNNVNVSICVSAL